MNILIAFDKFKDSMTAFEACEAAQKVLIKKLPNAQIHCIPLTDGGEGFCKVLTQNDVGQTEKVQIKDAHQKNNDAEYGTVCSSKLSPELRHTLKIDENSRIAIIEMAQSSGLEHIPIDKRDPWIASSYGTGQLICKAKKEEADAILIGIGGSATVDLGLGALEAMGLELLDSNGSPIRYSKPADWKRVAEIKIPHDFSFPPIFFACDVKNTLLGPDGAVRVYGPQKGLTSNQIEEYEKLYTKMAKHLCQVFTQPESLMSIPGTGAAGGIAFGLKLACGATLLPGFALVSSWLQLEKYCKNADLILTGEGKWDHSSLQGKAPGALIKMAEKHQTSVKIFAGQIERNLDLSPHSTIHKIAPEHYSQQQSIAEAKSLLAKKVGEIARQHYRFNKYS